MNIVIFYSFPLQEGRICLNIYRSPNYWPSHLHLSMMHWFNFYLVSHIGEKCWFWDQPHDRCSQWLWLPSEMLSYNQHFSPTDFPSPTLLLSLLYTLLKYSKLSSLDVCMHVLKSMEFEQTHFTAHPTLHILYTWSNFLVFMHFIF